MNKTYPTHVQRQCTGKVKIEMKQDVWQTELKAQRNNMTCRLQIQKEAQ